MSSCSKSTWPPRLVTVPGLHGSEGAHWQTWLERQFARSLRVEQADWDAPDLNGWAQSVRDLIARERGPLVLAAHSFGCLATAHALQQATHAADVAGVLFVAPASPEKFAFAGAFEARRLGVPSILIGSETDPWMPLAGAGNSRSVSAARSSIWVMRDTSILRQGLAPGRERSTSSIRWCIARRRCDFARRRSNWRRRRLFDETGSGYALAMPCRSEPVKSFRHDAS
ncbi:putative alpha/beta hydrolase family esterase [Paraburkholderia sp. GAS334]